jgi:hypothetical protein
MKKLVIPALLLGALQATGCIFVSDDDDTVDGTAGIDVSWTLESDGAPAGCPVGATTAAVNAQRDGSGDPFVDLFDCADGGGLADDLPLGTYRVWVDFTDSSGNVTYAQSEAADINLTVDGQIAQADFTVDVDNGFFDVQWEIAGGGCASVACENGVGVLSTHTSTTMGYDDKFNCEDGETGTVTTGALPIGDYVVVLSILDAQDASLGDSAEIQDSIDWGNQFKLLNDGPIAITPD